jgi:hypothetical protein
MKTWLSFILLIVLLFPATSHATIVSPGVQKHSINISAIDGAARPAIERFGLAALQISPRQSFTKQTNRFQDYTGGQPAFYGPYFSSAFFLPVEIAGGNRLSYNYLQYISLTN